MFKGFECLKDEELGNNAYNQNLYNKIKGKCNMKILFPSEQQINANFFFSESAVYQVYNDSSVCWLKLVYVRFRNHTDCTRSNGHIKKNIPTYRLLDIKRNKEVVQVS